MGYRDGQKLAIRGLKFSSQYEKGRVIHSWDQALPELNYHSYIITIPHRLFIIYFSQFPLTIIHGESRHALCRGTESRQCDRYRLDFTEQRLEVKPKCDRVEKKRKKNTYLMHCSFWSLVSSSSFRPRPAQNITLVNQSPKLFYCLCFFHANKRKFESLFNCLTFLTL